MKRILLLVASACALALAGCSADTTTSNWLKYTAWTADLAGKVCSDGQGSGTIEQGSINLRFSALGYTMGYEYKVDGVSTKGIVKAFIFPDYSFPELYFHFPYKSEQGEELEVSSTGIISSDQKSIHFDNFVVGYYPSSGFTSIEDVDFVR